MCVWAQLQNEFIDFKGQSERATAKAKDEKGKKFRLVCFADDVWMARKKKKKNEKENSPGHLNENP